MSQTTWQWQLDRAVRYAVSDTIAAVRYHIRTLESIPSKHRSDRHSHTVATWQNYLNQLWSLHYQLLALPDLEKVDWVPDESIYGAPLFMTFTTGINDARHTLSRTIHWIKKFQYIGMPDGVFITREADQIVLTGPRAKALVSKDDGTVRIPYLPNIDAYLARQEYVSQLEHIFDQLISLIGPNHPDWEKARPVREAAPAVDAKRYLIGA